MMSLKKQWPLFFVFCILFYCDAPRHNPLDPESEDYDFAQIRGTVLTYRVPHLPVPDAEVVWKKDGRINRTGPGGTFVFNEVTPADDWLLVSEKSYFPDSFRVEWSGSHQKEIRIYLNAKPVLDSLIFYSSILHLYNDLQLIQLSLKAAVTDPDNDVDSAYVHSPGLEVFAGLEYDVDSKFFNRDLSMQDLGINSPEAVIGHAFNIIVKDRLGNRLQLSSSVIKRIIKEQIELISPGGHDIVGSQPTLHWVPLQPGFPLEYRVEIYTDEMNLVQRKDHIPSNTSSLVLDAPLPPDKYRWAVWIIDEFQNRSRSKYKSFEVQSK